MFVLTYEDTSSKFYEKIGDEQIANEVFNDADSAKLWGRIFLQEIKSSALKKFIDKLEKEGYTDINKY